MAKSTPTRAPRLPALHVTRGRGAAVALALLSMIGCGIPRDPDGTLDRIQARGTYLVGVIAPGPDAADALRHDTLLARVSARTGASARLEPGAAERLLAKLEVGEVDLVIGELAADSPWRRRVTMLPPLEEEGGDDAAIELTVAARNGENAWIGLLFEEITAANGGRQ